MTTDRNGCSPELLEWLQELVAHNTISGTQSNLKLLDRIEIYLRNLGFAVRLTYSPDRKRANLFATLGDAKEGGLLLSGHTDVVPAEGQSWTHPPFDLYDDGLRLIGRGTCDMKGFLAAVLAVVGRLGPDRIALPLHLAFTYDEEIGCVGVRDLLADLARAGIRPAACIVGEPTSMKVVRAHKGRHAWRCKVQGRAAHSSLSGTGVNAAEVACELVSEISTQAKRLRQVANDDGFYVPYSTLATCRIHSGHAGNVIPQDAEFDFDLRYLPSTDPERTLAPILARAQTLSREMQDLDPDTQVVMERRTAVPALAHDPRAETFVRHLVAAGAQPGAHVAYATEGGLYQAQGIPTVVCGPGDIAQAHTADEYILKTQLKDCEEFLEALLVIPLPSHAGGFL